ncbi:LuxR family transcriptional regulator [Cohnella sp. 56]|uniref:LuxR family transcriptional regulator n=1 Tax=Cohnella sp. 56 TaxID=3113722 RepID=UPI0030E8ED4C
MTEREAGIESTRIGDELARMEARLFAGRRREQETFAALLDDPVRRQAVVHLYGPAGIGKTWLLGRLRLLAAERGVPWIACDLQYAVPTPAGVAAAIGDALRDREAGCDEADKAAEQGGVDSQLSEATAAIVRTLNALAGERGAILAIDAMEHGAALAGWLRGALLPALDRRVLVVLSGRHAPDAVWRDSPAWRSLGLEMQLGALSPQEIAAYMDRVGMADPVLRRHAAAWSGGIPLLLSRFAAQPPGREGFPDLAPLADDWLGGSGSPALRRAAWHASLLRVFDFDMLCAACGEDVPDPAAFAELLRLPCTIRDARGWHLHELAREALQAEFRAQRPDAWRAARERCIAGCAERLGRERDPQRTSRLLLELLYQLADSRLRAVLCASSDRRAHRLEALGAGNYPEVEAYLERRRTRPRRKAQSFVDYERDAVHTLDMNAAEDAERGRLAEAADWLALGLDAVQLLRDDEGRMIGLLAVIPIHRDTLGMLSSRPVTRAYFHTLTPAERLALAVPPETPAGWFIRMIDAEDTADARARSELIQEALGYLASGGLVLCSTPHPFYRELLLSIGMEEVHGAGHDDYGPGHRAGTYAADMRRGGLQAHMRKLIQRRGGQPAAQSLPYDFTGREREVAGYLLHGLTNPDIAARMYVSEIAVKKHVSSLLRKTGCANRGLLMKRLAGYEELLARR